MKKSSFLLSTFFLLLSFSAFADPEIDLVATKVVFSRGLDDDVSMSYSQHINIYVRNNGNVNFRNLGPYNIIFNSRSYPVYVYGPDASGGGLGGTIRPGEEGKLFLRLPLSTIRHCQDVTVDISAIPQYRLYADPHANDRKTLKAQEIGNRLLCLRNGPILPIPRRPLLPARPPLNRR